jgi:hypothetical protein
VAWAKKSWSPWWYRWLRVEFRRMGSPDLPKAISPRNRTKRRFSSIAYVGALLLVCLVCLVIRLQLHSTPFEPPLDETCVELVLTTLGAFDGYAAKSSNGCVQYTEFPVATQSLDRVIKLPVLGSCTCVCLSVFFWDAPIGQPQTLHIPKCQATGCLFGGLFFTQPCSVAFTGIILLCVQVIHLQRGGFGHRHDFPS